MTPPAILRSATACVLALAPSAAHACTVCDSSAGRSLRAGIFNGHFLNTLSLIALPLPVFAAVVALIHFSLPGFFPLPIPSPDRSA